MTELKSSLTEGDVEVGQVYELLMSPGQKYVKISSTTTVPIFEDGTRGQGEQIDPFDIVVFKRDDLLSKVFNVNPEDLAKMILSVQPMQSLYNEK